ncbi:MAG: preprotein translocase subunit SecG [Deltaproteobacteria bacterium]|nr:preprotein translocase subunit SecG [Deltaproteobacteria bacterium]MBW2052159.1 preprotein translocase subunit SecG [Deltaproteobacteria bacterium]MBW2139667.1 preprotein translocase subunit SecG [Deltaproteobacteria bacterium]MBW2322279.1 preprotein translocase subunit SecG [Deltaproteobacteria bacterium]
MALPVIILHIIVCVALIMIVLLQTGKGSDIGAAFGAGASQTVFGSQGAGTFLTKLTAVAAIIFMLTSLGLNLLSGHRTGGGSIMKGIKEPVQQEAPVQPAAPAEQGKPIETQGEDTR